MWENFIEGYSFFYCKQVGRVFESDMIRHFICYLFSWYLISLIWMNWVPSSLIKFWFTLMKILIYGFRSNMVHIFINFLGPIYNFLQLKNHKSILLLFLLSKNENSSKVMKTCVSQTKQKISLHFLRRGFCFFFI